MARPFILVSQQDADNDHQILEQLLEQLYQIIRQIILRRGRIVAQQPVPLPRNRTNQQRRSAEEVPVQQNLDLIDHVLPLPDLITSHSAHYQPTMAAPVPSPRQSIPTAAANERPQVPPRRPRRLRDYKKQRVEMENPESSQQPETWQQIGKDLREIADRFKATSMHRQEDGNSSTVTNVKKSNNLLSLLVPSPFSNSIWTAVAFLIGWKLLTGRRW